MPPEKVVDTHYTEPQMDRRLKVYREQNVHDSGASVQCFFAKAIEASNNGNTVSDNIKLVNSFNENEQEVLRDL